MSRRLPSNHRMCGRQDPFCHRKHIRSSDLPSCAQARCRSCEYVLPPHWEPIRYQHSRRQSRFCSVSRRLPSNRRMCGRKDPFCHRKHIRSSDLPSCAQGRCRSCEYALPLGKQSYIPSRCLIQEYDRHNPFDFHSRSRRTNVPHD